MKKLVLWFLMLSVFAAVATGAFTYTYDTDTPLGTDAPSVLDDHHRLTKDAIQERMNVCGYWPLTGTEVSDADAGKMRTIIFRAPQAADPTTVDEDEYIIYTKDVSDVAELFGTDENEAAIQITSGGYLLGSSLLDGSVYTAEIADANVTVAKMADDSIDSDQYVDGSIDAAHIADANITTAKLNTAAVTAAKIGAVFGTRTNLDSSSNTLAWNVTKDASDQTIYYKATSDGYVTVSAITGHETYIAGLIKIGGSGSWIIITGEGSNAPQGYAFGLSMPVAKDDHIAICSSRTVSFVVGKIYFLPLGTGSLEKQ